MLVWGRRPRRARRRASASSRRRRASRGRRPCTARVRRARERSRARSASRRASRSRRSRSTPATTITPRERCSTSTRRRGPFRTVRREPELLRRDAAPAVAQPGPGAAAVGGRHGGRADRRRRPRDLGGVALPRPAPGGGRAHRGHSPAHLQPRHSGRAAEPRSHPSWDASARVRFARLRAVLRTPLVALASGAQLRLNRNQAARRRGL